LAESLLLERVKEIEPSYAAWKVAALPLNYTLERLHCNRDDLFGSGLMTDPWEMVNAPPEPEQFC